FVDIESLPVRGWGELGTALPVCSELVVLLAFVGVAQDFVSFLGLLELLFSLLVVRVEVRMVFAGQLAIGLLDFSIAGAARHAENLVIVLKLHSHTRTILPNPKSEGDFQAFAGGNDVGKNLLGVCQNLFDDGVFVIGVVMIKSDLLYSGLNAGFDRL